MLRFGRLHEGRAGGFARDLVPGGLMRDRQAGFAVDMSRNPELATSRVASHRSSKNSL